MSILGIGRKKDEKEIPVQKKELLQSASEKESIKVLEPENSFAQKNKDTNTEKMSSLSNFDMQPPILGEEKSKRQEAEAAKHQNTEASKKEELKKVTKEYPARDVKVSISSPKDFPSRPEINTSIIETGEEFKNTSDEECLNEKNKSADLPKEVKVEIHKSTKQKKQKKAKNLKQKSVALDGHEEMDRHTFKTPRSISRQIALYRVDHQISMQQLIVDALTEKFKRDGYIN